MSYKKRQLIFLICLFIGVLAVAFLNGIAKPIIMGVAVVGIWFCGIQNVRYYKLTNVKVELMDAIASIVLGLAGIGLIVAEVMKG